MSYVLKYNISLLGVVKYKYKVAQHEYIFSEAVIYLPPMYVFFYREDHFQ